MTAGSRSGDEVPAQAGTGDRPEKTTAAPDTATPHPPGSGAPVNGEDHPEAVTAPTNVSAASVVRVDNAQRPAGEVDIVPAVPTVSAEETPFADGVRRDDAVPGKLTGAPGRRSAGGTPEGDRDRGGEHEAASQETAGDGAAGHGAESHGTGTHGTGTHGSGNRAGGAREFVGTFETSSTSEFPEHSGECRPVRPGTGREPGLPDAATDARAVSGTAANLPVAARHPAQAGGNHAGQSPAGNPPAAAAPAFPTDAGARHGGPPQAPLSAPTPFSRAWWAAKRRRCYEILDRDSAHDRTAERVNIALIALIVLNVLVAMLETVPSLLLRDMPFFRAFEALSLVVFGVEYALRLWSAPENPRYRGMPALRARLRYMVTPAAIIDLVAWLPFIISMLFRVELRTLAIFRLLRFVKLARYSPGMQSLFEVLHSERQSLMACFWLLAGSVLIAASAMYVAEGSAQPEHFGSIPAAMWWAMTTVTTVGYGDTFPITAGGKVIASLTMITGIIMLALPVGIIATAFVDVIKRRDFVITWGMVARVPLFADLDAVGIGEIHKALSAHTAQPGEVIVRRGETARSMYFIASGEVLLEFPNETVVLTEGQFFGEMALVRSSKRAATARARTRSMLLMLDAADLSEVVHRHPEIGVRIAAMAKDVEGPHAMARRSDIANGELDEAEDGDG